MKKSNKLLLGGLLAVLLLITAVHITLYAKFKNSNYSVSDTDEFGRPMQTFPGVAFVTVRNVRNATVKFGDVAQVGKDMDEAVQYVQHGDTLLITGKGYSNYPLVFNMPYNATVSVFNSSLIFLAGKKIAATNPVIYLHRSNVIFSGVKSPLQLESVKVAASDSSTVSFPGNTQVSNLEVQLSNSSIEYGGGDFGQLSIITDSVSRISLQSKHLFKAKIRTITP
jgi:hypothetical protein